MELYISFREMDVFYLIFLWSIFLKKPIHLGLYVASFLHKQKRDVYVKKICCGLYVTKLAKTLEENKRNILPLGYLKECHLNVSCHYLDGRVHAKASSSKRPKKEDDKTKDEMIDKLSGEVEKLKGVLRRIARAKCLRVPDYLYKATYKEKKIQ